MKIQDLVFFLYILEFFTFQAFNVKLWFKMKKSHNSITGYFPYKSKITKHGICNSNDTNQTGHEFHLDLLLVGVWGCI